ncbi:MAG: hypothetical protein QGI88_13295 [SAR202 cluster bacterium]|nr:hypothetical protein [SAR202 cluster bacterium]
MVFDILNDVAGHNELAGSGEVLTIRQKTDGPIGLGSIWEADERLVIGGEAMEFTATSVVVSHDAPNTISWIPSPPFPTKRIQWRYHLSPEGAGTKVVQEVEVDLGEPEDSMLQALKANYVSMRGNDIAAGLEKTLTNLKQAAERRVQ